MIVEIHQPEIERLIEQRMASGAFHDVEEVLPHALTAAPFPAAPAVESSGRTGADLIAAMQRIPYPEIDIEPLRPQMPVHEPAF